MTQIKYYCCDCKIEVWKNSKRCWDCYLKFIQISENNNNYRHGLCVKKVGTGFCLDCGVSISRGATRCLSCNTSSEEFSHKLSLGLRGLFEGEKNPNYIDGRSKIQYPIEFNEKLKFKVRKRDNYTCQCCGMTEEEHFIICGFNLTVHHIDYDKKNCKENNLITTCKACNSRANFNQDYWQNFYLSKIKEILNVPSISNCS